MWCVKLRLLLLQPRHLHQSDSQYEAVPKRVSECALNDSWYQLFLYQLCITLYYQPAALSFVPLPNFDFFLCFRKPKAVGTREGQSSYNMIVEYALSTCIMSFIPLVKQ